jgi:signal transduction histidine kinase/DNA-binding response OmpR family regulator
MATILIVDDQSVNRKYLFRLLSGQGHRMLEAADGREGLAMVRAEHPDLVITDVLMPVMDGFEFVRLLRLDSATKGIPVVFQTAHYGEHEARALALSSVSFILTKPVDPDEALSIVGRALAGETETGVPLESSLLAPAFDREHLRLITDKLSQKAEDLRTVNKRLRSLINVGLELASERDFDRLLQKVCAAACDLFAATYVTLGIVGRHDRMVQRVVTQRAGVADWIKQGDAVPGILATVVNERRTMRGDNAGGDPADLELPSLHPTIQAFLAAPIESPTHVYGWILLVGNEGRAFTEHDEELVMALAGQVGRIHALAYEIDERKQAEEAARASEAQLRLALEAAHMVIFDERIVDNRFVWPDGHDGLFSSGEVGDTPEAFGRRVHPDDLPAVNREIARCIATRTPFVQEFRVVSPDTGEHWAAARGEFTLGDDGQIMRMRGAVLDITERKRAEMALVEVAQRKDEFLATLAHELRNPLAPIRFALEGLKPGAPPLVLERARGVIDRQVTQLVRLVDDLLDTSRITTNKIQLRREPVAFAEVMRAALESVTPLATAMGHDVELGLPPMPMWVNADAARLVQVFANILNNAVKFTPRGGRISFTAEARNNEAVVHVRDNGIGIPPHALSRVFEMFQQETKALDRSTGGLGIGLTLARRLVEMHDGRIEMRSGGLGQGSDVEIRLPTTTAAASRVTAIGGERPARAATRSLRAMIVDDNIDAANMLETFVSALGHTTRVAYDGISTIALAEAFAPDVILLDIGLPIMNGYAVAEELRRRPEFGHPHIAAVTGWDQPEDLRREREAGIDSHFTKPIELIALEGLLSAVARKVPSAGDGAVQVLGPA